MIIKWKHVGNDNYFRSWSVLRLTVNLFIKVPVALLFTYPVRAKSKILINKVTRPIDVNLWSPSKVTFYLAFFTDVLAKTVHSVALTGLANRQSVSNQLYVIFPLCSTDLDPALLVVGTVLGTTSTVGSKTELAPVLTEFMTHWEQPWCLALNLGQNAQWITQTCSPPCPQGHQFQEGVSQQSHHGSWMIRLVSCRYYLTEQGH